MYVCWSIKRMLISDKTSITCGYPYSGNLFLNYWYFSKILVNQHVAMDLPTERPTNRSTDLQTKWRTVSHHHKRFWDSWRLYNLSIVLHDNNDTFMHPLVGQPTIFLSSRNFKLHKLYLFCISFQLFHMALIRQSNSQSS